MQSKHFFRIRTIYQTSNINVKQHLQKLEKGTLSLCHFSTQSKSMIFHFRLIVVMAEITTITNMKILIQIFNYDEKLWIQKQIIDIPENNKPTFLIKFHGRLFISSATFGSLVLDRKNMLFVYFPEWINETTLMKSRKLSIIFLK